MIPRFTSLLEAALGDGLLSRLAKGAALTLALQVVGQGLGYLAQVLLARELGTHEFGVFRYAWSWISLLALISCLGFPVALQRFVPAYEAKESWRRLRGLLAGSTLATAVAATVSAIGLTTLMWTFYRYDLLEPDQAVAVALSSWLVLPMAIQTIASETARAHRRFLIAYLPVRVGRPAAMLSLVGFCFLFRDFDALTALILLGGLLVLLLLGHSLWLVRVISAHVRAARARYEWSAWLNVALPVFLVVGFGVILNQLGVLMVGSLMGAEEAGIFSAATQTARVVSFFVAAVASVSTPTFSGLYHSGKRRAQERMLSSVVHWMFWPALAIGVLLILASRFVLGLYGTDFAQFEGRTALIVLVLGHISNGASGPVGELLNVTGHQRVTAVVVGSCTALSVVASVLLIPMFGMVGGASAIAGTMVVRNVALVVAMKRLTGLDSSMWRVAARSFKKSRTDDNSER